MNFGSGSGQQIVTCKKGEALNGALWTVKEGDYNEDPKVDQIDKLCRTGEPIRCGDLIRLEHQETSKNLHSHNVRSPITGNNEVSGFGDDGEGDSGDNWKIECLNPSTGLVNPNRDIILGSAVV